MKSRSFATRVLSGRKGAAMESALAFLIIAFLFCFLLTSVAFMGRFRASSEKRRTDAVMEREQIAEDFLAYLKTAGDTADTEDFLDYLVTLGDSVDDKYTVTVTNKSPDFTLTLTRKDDGGVMLELHAEIDAGGKVTVISRHNTGF